MKSNELSRFRREELGFVFQDFNLLDTLNGFENIILPLSISGVPHKQAKERVEEVAKRLDINEVLTKYPYEMSGGQRQRTAAARAIITNPAMILADEPTGSLDSKSARMLLESLENLHKNLNATILMVTHDAFTASYCSRILFIKDGRLFNELVRGSYTRKEFFGMIIDVITLLGGDAGNVL
jgi:putative ABC transport system ATP-binding protein